MLSMLSMREALDAAARMKEKKGGRREGVEGDLWEKEHIPTHPTAPGLATLAAVNGCWWAGVLALTGFSRNPCRPEPDLLIFVGHSFMLFLSQYFKRENNLKGNYDRSGQE